MSQDPVQVSKELILRAEETATAYMAWNERWKTETGRREWLKPESDVKEMAELLQNIGEKIHILVRRPGGLHKIALKVDSIL